MSKEFNPKLPFSEVQGDSRAAFYQKGHYFHADGSYCPPEDAGKPSGSGSFANQVAAGVAEELAKENAKKPLELIDESNPSTNREADIEAARKRAEARGKPETPVVEPEPDARLEALNGLHITQLRKMVAELGLEPAKGRGSKAANIKLLLENTE